MLYLSHAYDGASENENEEAEDHHKVLRGNNGNFQSSNLPKRNGIAHKQRTTTKDCGEGRSFSIVKIFIKKWFPSQAKDHHKVLRNKTKMG